MGSNLRYRRGVFFGVPSLGVFEKAAFFEALIKLAGE